MGRRPQQEVIEAYKEQFTNVIKIWMQRAARIAVWRWLNKDKEIYK